MAMRGGNMESFSIWHWLVVLLFIGVVVALWKSASRFGDPAPRWLVILWTVPWLLGPFLLSDDPVRALGSSLVLMLLATALVRFLWRAGTWLLNRART